MKTVRAVIYLILSFAVIFTMWVLVRSLSKDTSLVSQLIACVCFGLWAVSPYAFLAWSAHRFGKTALGLLVISVGSVAVSAYGLWGLINAFFIHLDPQSAFVLVLLPFWQWIGVVVIVVIAFVLGQRRAGDLPK